MNMTSKKSISSIITPMWSLDQSDLQKKVEKLSTLCRIESAEAIKNSLMNQNGAFLNMPNNKYNSNDDSSAQKIPSHLRKKTTLKGKKKKQSGSDPFQVKPQVYRKEIVPGYLYQRTPDNVHITLTENFWRKETTAMMNSRMVDDQQKADQSCKTFEGLKSEVDQLRLLLEGEKVLHKTRSVKSRENHMQELNNVREEHQENIRTIKLEQKEKRDLINAKHLKKIEDLQLSAATEKNNMSDEIHFLQKQFDAHKVFLEEEMNRKWTSKKTELMHQMEEKVQKLLHEQRIEMLKEKKFELDQLTADHNEQTMKAKETRQQEIEKLLRNFGSSSHDAEKLNQALHELEKFKEENIQIKKQLAHESELLRKSGNELSDVKVKLSGFQSDFVQKVDAVEEKFAYRINELTLENVELRRKYLRKCEELHAVNMKLEEKQGDAILDAKELMQALVLSRTRTMMSLNEFHSKPSEKRKSSAPVTSLEIQLAQQKEPKKIPKSAFLRAPYMKKCALLSRPYTSQAGLVHHK